MARVVRIRLRGGEPWDVYIGREFRKHGHSLDGSVWGNPFIVGRDGDLENVLQKYEAYIRKRLLEEPSLFQQFLDLRGKTLGCWCKPGPCHGDVLVKIMRDLEATTLAALAGPSGI